VLGLSTIRDGSAFIILPRPGLHNLTSPSFAGAPQQPCKEESLSHASYLPDPSRRRRGPSTETGRHRRLDCPSRAPPR
jgi:hypothetical protein